MKNIMLTWATMALLSLLVACGSSSSDDSQFKTSNTPVEPPEDIVEPPEEKDVTEPETVIEDNVTVALGSGVGAGFQAGIAEVVGLSSNEVLAANGSISVKVDLVDLQANNEQFFGLREVTFESTCSKSGLAEFVPKTINASGFAKTTYNDLGCGKESGSIDDVVVYIDDKDAETPVTPNDTARATISVAAAKVGGIDFASAEPESISINGFGTASSQSFSEVIFKVTDRSGNPMPSRTVNFAFAQNLGGATLSQESVITQVDGTAKVILRAGVSEGKVIIKASLESEGETYQVTSQEILIQTKFPEADSLTLSASTFNPSGWSKSGSKVTFTARLNDHFGNHVLDDTEVSFRATGGSIEAGCKTTAGQCSVDWESANPRPVDGYVSVVAYVKGVGVYQDNIKGTGDGFFDPEDNFTTYAEQFIDANGNGQYDPAGAYQPIVDIDGDGTPEFLWAANAYRANVQQPDGSYDLESVNFEEEYIDANSDGSFNTDKGDVYQGINCSDNAKAIGHCAQEFVTVLKTARIQMSQGNSAYIEGPFPWSDSLGRYDTSKRLSCIDGSQIAQRVAWRVADSESRRNHLPSGSTIQIGLDDVDAAFASGVGTLKSISPAPVWSVWSTLPDNVVKSNVQKKYDYLNTRGHLVEASLLRAETFTTVTFLGSAGINVKTVDGAELVGGSVQVDLKGQVAALSINNIPQANVDVTNGPQTYTVTLSNTCLQGLPIGSKLLIGLINGKLDSAAGRGGATNGPAVVDSNALVAIDIVDSEQAAIVDLTISSDNSPASQGNIPNALTVAYSIADANGNERIINLNDFSVKDN